VKSPGYFDKVIDMGRYNSIMPKTVIHVSEAEAARDFAGIASAKAHEEESGKVPALDPDFAADVEEIVNSRKSWNPPAWE
jgi:hypothetical protein